MDAYPEKRGSTVPYVLKKVGGVKVGIISFGAIRESDQKVDEYALRKARFAAYKAARDASDILILLDQANVATREWIDSNTSRLGAPDIIVSGIQNMGLLKEEVVGKTYIVPTSQQGKTVGVVDVEVAPDRSLKMSVRKIPLEPEIAEDENITKLIQKFTSSNSEVVHIIREPEANPVSANSNHNNPVAAPVITPQPTTTNIVSNPYYSPGMCKSCHSKEYDDWKQTKHAKAVKTLVDEKKVQGECLTCHSEMYRRNKSVVISSDNIAGVECATCHADAIPHGMERHDVANKTQVDPNVCLSCHTKERSPNYDENTYFPKVIHATVDRSK